MAEAQLNLERPAHHECFAFYSSVLGGIITDPDLMNVPLDDHMVTRGHAVFDTCNVTRGRAFGLDMHVERFCKSAAAARIDVKRIGGAKRIKEIVLDTIAASGKKNGVFVRMWLSIGRGDFNITPYGCVQSMLPSLYIVVHADPSAKRGEVLSEIQPTAEVTTDIPLKNSLSASIKSNNYLVNALCAMDAHDRGGHYGLQLDERGFLAEVAIGSVGFVLPNKRFVSPKPGRILRSTTVRRVFALLPQLVEEGFIDGFEFKDVSPAEASSAIEMVGMGGHGVEVITKLNGKPVGDGNIGPVGRKLVETVHKDLLSNEEHLQEIPYSSYDCSRRGTKEVTDVNRSSRMLFVCAVSAAAIALTTTYLCRRKQ